MVSQKISEAMFNSIKELHQQGLSGRAIAEKLGINKSTATKYSKMEFFPESGAPAPETPHMTEERVVTGDTMTISLPKTRIHTLEQLVEFCEIDLEEWRVERWIANKWEVGAKNDFGVVDVTPLYQVKATLVRRVEVISVREEIEALVKTNQSRIKHPVARIVPRAEKSGLLLEISIPDLHMAKMAWSKETGHGDYDLKISQKVYRDALAALLTRTGHLKFERIIFVIGNDLLQTDTKESTTTSGTRVDSDSRYHKAFRAACTLMIESVEQLALLAPVTVVSCPGNHDAIAAWHVAESLSFYFRGNKAVTFLTDPTPRKYIEFGLVMLGWTHGHQCKHNKLPLVMASGDGPKVRAMFGRTRWHEMHLGHRHTEMEMEYNGVVIRYLPALCEPDSWHADSGFVGNHCAAVANVYSKTEGPIARATYTVPETIGEQK